jgi:CBS domain-containing protein
VNLPTDKLKSIPVRRYMATRLMTFSAETPIAEAVRMLVKNKYTGAPVVDAQGTLIGMLSEKDCLRVAVLANAAGAAAALVGDYMTTAVESVAPDASLFEVAERFVKAAYKRLPVVENGRLVGQISRIDVLRAIEALL